MFDLKQFKEIVFDYKSLEINKEDKEKVENCYNFLSKFSKNKVIYGINTGFGPMAQYKISDKDLNDLQYNIIRSHSSGAGEA